ncbi:hypothetical protein [uncultured Rothia sp.]|uniref:hypothetical protein n=1 Tax=uncultured Rothia sp. TaxID=316088 RepID=UPI0028D55C8E|nr:hypothetical protein [uncultured Rothia sp.]
MPGWWESFLAKWSWDDPTLLLGFASFVVAVASLVVTASISIVLWKMGDKQAKRDSEQAKRDSELQAEFLASLTSVSQLQRRDALLGTVTQASDPRYLEALWKEIREYEGADWDFLLNHLRANPAIALPGTSTGVKVQDNLTDAAVSNYVDGLERRYAEGDGYWPYPGLLKFIAEVTRQGSKVEVSRIVELVTGPTAEKQRPGHVFYRELVNTLPQVASPLLHAVERIDSRAPGGLKLNVLTGALLAVKDMEPEPGDSTLSADESQELKGEIAQALAYLLHRDVLRSFDRWEIEGSTDSVTATAAWLIRAVGWAADADSHLAMRMIQNLAFAIKSVPKSDRIGGWGIDDVDVRQGFEWISEKRPDLWEVYGEELEAAATEIGPWKEDPSS